MKTLRQFSNKPESISAIASWYLADLSEARGKQEHFTRQTPQRLKALREPALIESAVSSNRIEGVTVSIVKALGPFRIADIQRDCPGVSLDMIRQVLKATKAAGQVRCLGRGRSAKRQKTRKGIR